MGTAPHRIVFLTGPARSGTTLLYRFLADGPHYRVFPECGPVTSLMRLSQLMKTTPEDRLAAWFGDQDGRLAVFRGFAEQLAGRLVADEPKRDILFLKDPNLIDIYQELQQVFPEIPVIVTIRSPMDILRSRARVAQKKGAQYDLTADIEEVRGQIRRVRALAQSRVENDRVALVRYESLVADPDTARQKLTEFLGTEIAPTLSEIKIVKDDPFVTNMSGSDQVVERKAEEADVFSSDDLAMIEEALAFEIRFAKRVETLA